jgi:archaellum component FlaC
MKCILLISLATTLVIGVACDNNKKPSYEELKTENEELRAQLNEVNEKIQQAKSDLDDLRHHIEDVELVECHEGAASDMDQKADDGRSDAPLQLIGSIFRSAMLSERSTIA